MAVPQLVEKLVYAHGDGQKTSILIFRPFQSHIISRQNMTSKSSLLIFFQIQSGIPTKMHLFWKLFHLLNVLKSARWVTFGPYFLASLLVLSAALVAIGTIAAVAKIAFDEQSWVAFIVLLVTMVQVGNIKIITK